MTIFDEHADRVEEQMKKTREAAGHECVFVPNGPDGTEVCRCGKSRRPV